ncbi:MAG: hypothetical protein ACOY4K_08365 [Pseudomonadota bacterium]
MIGERYLAFRSADGAVLGLEPVRRSDDALLQRVRAIVADRRRLRLKLEIATFFRGSAGVALVRLTRCEARHDYRPNFDVEAIILRGAFDAGPNEDYIHTKTADGSWSYDYRAEGYSFDWIGEYLAQIGAPCRVGMELLVMTGPFDINEDSPPRAARVRNGKLRTADLLSGYQLVGPAEISIDQAFAWSADATR